MPKVTIEEVAEICRRELPIAAQWGFSVERLEPGDVTVRLPYRGDFVRPGGTVAGPMMMALADFAMYVAVMTRIGPKEMTVTSNLTCNFLRRPPPADVLAHARLLKLGRRLAYGEATIYSASEAEEELVAHATITYSVPPGEGE